MSKTNLVTCSNGTCREPAAYKIAARWSDGRLAELKTYGFACSEHLGEVFREGGSTVKKTTSPRPERPSKSWRSTATSLGSAIASCNGCGDWKRTTGPDGGGVLPFPGTTVRSRLQPRDSIPQLRCASVTNGATGAAIARRTALGFPS